MRLFVLQTVVDPMKKFLKQNNNEVLIRYRIFQTERKFHTQDSSSIFFCGKKVRNGLTEKKNYKNGERKSCLAVNFECVHKEKEPHILSFSRQHIAFEEDFQLCIQLVLVLTYRVTKRKLTPIKC